MPQRSKKKIIQQYNFSLKCGTEGAMSTYTASQGRSSLPPLPPPHRSRRSTAPKKRPGERGGRRLCRIMLLCRDSGMPRGPSWLSPARPAGGTRGAPLHGLGGGERRAGCGAGHPRRRGGGRRPTGGAPFPAGGAPARAGPGQRRHEDQRKWCRMARAAPAGWAGPPEAEPNPGAAGDRLRAVTAGCGEAVPPHCIHSLYVPQAAAGRRLVPDPPC